MKKILLLLFTMIAVLSCGGGEKGATDAKGGKKIAINVRDEAKTLDPAMSTDTTGTAVLEQLQEGLYQLDEKGLPVEGIAESSTVSEDGLNWTFKLRENAKWSNGDPITANDFKFAWLRVLNPETAAEYAYMLYYIKGAEEYNVKGGKPEDVAIRVIDDRTLEVDLNAPVPYFKGLTAYTTYRPINQKFYDSVGGKYALDKDSMLFSGPYKMTEWVTGSHIMLEKNENYWNAANIKIDKIEMKHITDNAAALNAFNNDEVDLTDISAEQFVKFENDERLVPVNDGSSWYVEYNLINNDFLANKKIRQALTLALDKDTLANSVLKGVGMPSTGLVPTGVTIGLEKDFTEERGDIYPKYNPTEAKKLYEEGLKELGLTEGPELELIFNDSGNNKKIAEFIQANYKENLGYNIKLTPLPFKERIKRLQNKTFELALAGWSLDFADPISYLDLFMTGGGNNHPSYSNPRYDELLKTIKSTDKQEIRVPAMIELEKILADDMPVGMVYYRQRPYLVNPRLIGVKFKAISSEYHLDDADVK